MIRRAFSDGKAGPVFTLSLKNQTEHYLNQFDSILVVSVGGFWLLPSETISRHTRSIRLSAKYDEFKVENHQDITAISETGLHEKLRQKLVELQREEF